MKKETKEKVNELARLFYKMEGYQVNEGYDFSKSSHPQEKGMWNKALVAHYFYTGENVLKYQKGK